MAGFYVLGASWTPLLSCSKKICINRNHESPTRHWPSYVLSNISFLTQVVKLNCRISHLCYFGFLSLLWIFPTGKRLGVVHSRSSIVSGTEPPPQLPSSGNSLAQILLPNCRLSFSKFPIVSQKSGWFCETVPPCHRPSTCTSAVNHFMHKFSLLSLVVTCRADKRLESSPPIYDGNWSCWRIEPSDTCSMTVFLWFFLTPDSLSL